MGRESMLSMIDSAGNRDQQCHAHGREFRCAPFPPEMATLCESKELVMYQKILKFWFEDIEESKWWAKDAEFDRLIFEKYSLIHGSAARCELYEWRNYPEGRLAEIIVLDQFSRNMFRNSSLAFAYDGLALALSQEAISKGADASLDSTKKGFLYLPFMHSESKKIHDVALELYEKNGIKANIEYELKHKAIIDRFGRYPHRNNVLGRESTEEEIEFLRQPGTGF